MPRTCTVCGHAERAAIDTTLAAGTAYRDIARRFALSKDAIARHATDHIAVAIAASETAKREGAALDVVEQLRAINGAALAILRDAQAKRDPDTALKAIDRIQRQIELQAKLLGDLDDRPQVTISLVPSGELAAFANEIMDALRFMPEARAAIAARLLALNAPDASVD